MKYLKKFLSASTYNDYIGDEYPVPNVSYVKNTEEVFYTEDDYEKMYLTTEALNSGWIGMKIGSSVDTTRVPSVSYSVDDGETWTTVNNVNSQNVFIKVNTNVGSKILWKCNAGANIGGTGESNRITFSGSSQFNLYGNSMSLLYGDNFEGQTETPPDSYTFAYLFYKSKCVDASNLVLPSEGVEPLAYYYMFANCSVLVSAPKKLPATSLNDRCYGHMFYYCTSLVSIPNILPALSLASSCYEYMFYYCTKLSVAPKLPATTLALAFDCYWYMFGNCSKLAVAPRLPATTLETYCYGYMFYRCTSLRIAPELPATVLKSSCYSHMFDSCTNLIKAPELSATELATYCYDSMFYGCSSLATAPKLPATDLPNYCYYYMFYGCSSLTIAPELPAERLMNSSYAFMFSNCYKLESVPLMSAREVSDSSCASMFSSCRKLVSAPNLPATELANSCYKNMFNGCTSLEVAPNLLATTLGNSCYESMFYNCNNLKYVQEVLPATTLKPYCYRSMFTYCQNLTIAPELRATTLVNGCYNEMFRYCTNLSDITCLATNPDTTYTKYWTEGVAQEGYFYGNPSATWVQGRHGVPFDWDTNVNLIHMPEPSGEIAMYVDDFLMMSPSEINWFIDDPSAYQVKRYTYDGVFRYNNTDFYSWQIDFDYDNGGYQKWYALTNTTNLSSASIDYNLANVFNFPIVAYLDEDTILYQNYPKESILAYEVVNGTPAIYVDDFIRCEEDIYEVIDDPGNYGCNYYEYCEEFEYEGDTFYIWKGDDNVNPYVMFLLTDTINYTALNNMSLEYDLENVGTFPIIAYLGEDLNETYNGEYRLDNIVKVIEL